MAAAFVERSSLFADGRQVSIGGGGGGGVGADGMRDGGVEEGAALGLEAAAFVARLNAAAQEGGEGRLGTPTATPMQRVVLPFLANLVLYLEDGHL